MEELEKNETSTQAEENTVSLASAQALADALTKIEAYTPTTWVDNSSPDIDAEHLNKPEQAIKRVTDALNSAVDVIKDLQSQVTKNAGDISTVNSNLGNSRKLVQVSTNNHGFSLGYDDSGLYSVVDLTRIDIAQKTDLWPQNPGISIPAGTDMRTVTTPGHYYCENNNMVASLKNCPLSEAFTLVVYRAAGGRENNIYYIAQEYTSYLCNKRIIQTYNKDSGNWTTREIQFKS